MSALRRHRVLQRAEERSLRRLPSGYVSTNEHGDPVTPDYLTRRFAEMLAETDLPPIRLHDLRHVAASLAIQAGADLKVIQDQLGHSSIVITADAYVSILPDHARKAAEDTAALITRAGRRPPGGRRTRRPERPARIGSREVDATGSDQDPGVRGAAPRAAGQPVGTGR